MRRSHLSIPVLFLLASLILAACGADQPAAPPPTTQAADLQVADWVLYNALGQYDEMAQVATQLGAPLVDGEPVYVTAGYTFSHTFEFVQEGVFVRHTFTTQLREPGELIFLLYRRQNGMWGAIPLGHVVAGQGKNLQLIPFINPPTLQFSDEEKQQLQA